MRTTLQCDFFDTPVRERLNYIRRSLGIPADNKEYHYVFVYPHPDEQQEFDGGYVYYKGAWRGLNKVLNCM